MPALQELKDKWFLSENQFDEYGLAIRHAGSLVSLHTDNNLVTVVGEGASYVEMWHDLIEVAKSIPGTILFHTGWDINDFQTIPGDPNSLALRMLIDAAQNQVDVYVLMNHGLLPNPRTDREAVIEMLKANGVIANFNMNYPSAGSSHQKFFVSKFSGQEATALVGSCDVAAWNQLPFIHEIGIRIEGPAVFDIEQTFIETWNSPINSFSQNIISSVANYADKGPHSVQVLRTNAIQTFPPSGEFSIWCAYLNAIKNAESYIYLEDQYFQSFDWPPCFERGPADPKDMARNTDLVYQLGKAIERGVKVAVLTNYLEEGTYYRGGYFTQVINYQREYSVQYLLAVAAGEPALDSGGDFIVGRLQQNPNINHSYIHSKLMLVDDEFSIIGSSNFDQRSMTHDNELSVGIVDRDNEFTRILRIGLLQEHLQISDPVLGGLEDWDQSLDQLKAYITNGLGNVRPFEITGESTATHGMTLRKIVEPYAGPPQLR